LLYDKGKDWPLANRDVGSMSYITGNGVPKLGKHSCPGHVKILFSEHKRSVVLFHVCHCWHGASIKLDYGSRVVDAGDTRTPFIMAEAVDLGFYSDILSWASRR